MGGIVSVFLQCNKLLNLLAFSVISGTENTQKIYQKYIFTHSFHILKHLLVKVLLIVYWFAKFQVIICCCFSFLAQKLNLKEKWFGKMSKFENGYLLLFFSNPL